KGRGGVRRGAPHPPPHTGERGPAAWSAQTPSTERTKGGGRGGRETTTLPSRQGEGEAEELRRQGRVRAGARDRGGGQRTRPFGDAPKPDSRRSGSTAEPLTGAPSTSWISSLSPWAARAASACRWPSSTGPKVSRERPPRSRKSRSSPASSTT